MIPEKTKQGRARNILGYLLLYAAFGWLGYAWLQDINRKGYYIDSKHGIRFYGNEARLTTYGMIAGSVLGIIYTGFYLVTALKRQRQPH